MVAFGLRYWARAKARGDMLWINEGRVLNDSGALITTSYVDLREDGSRTAIPALIKGCRREHALEDGDAVLVSKPERFREFGEGLIRDEQEGFANGKLRVALG